MKNMSLAVSMARRTMSARASLLHAASTTQARPPVHTYTPSHRRHTPASHIPSLLECQCTHATSPHSRTLSRWSVSAWSGVPTRISRSLALPPDPRPFSILSQLVLWCPSVAGTERRPGISIGADDAGRPGGAVSPPLSSGWPLLDILPGGLEGEGEAVDGRRARGQGPRSQWATQAATASGRVGGCVGGRSASALSRSAPCGRGPSSVSAPNGLEASSSSVRERRRRTHTGPRRWRRRDPKTLLPKTLLWPLPEA